MRTKFSSSRNRRKKCFIHAGCSCIIHRMQDVLLVLETSCVQSSVAAWSGESLLCQAAWRAERNHSSAIFKAVRQVLDALEGRRLKEIVVGSGPGAYGGIRVALAVADGLSLVHGSRVAAFSSLHGTPSASRSAPAITARRRPASSRAVRSPCTWGARPRPTRSATRICAMRSRTTSISRCARPAARRPST